MEGSWSCKEKYLYINIELRTVKFAILTFCKGKTIKWSTLRWIMGKHGENDNEGEKWQWSKWEEKKIDLDSRDQYLGIFYVTTYRAYCRVPSRDQKHEIESVTVHSFSNIFWLRKYILIFEWIRYLFKTFSTKLPKLRRNHHEISLVTKIV